MNIYVTIQTTNDNDDKMNSSIPKRNFFMISVSLLLCMKSNRYFVGIIKPHIRRKREANLRYIKFLFSLFSWNDNYLFELLIFKNDERSFCGEIFESFMVLMWWQVFEELHLKLREIWIGLFLCVEPNNFDPILALIPDIFWTVSRH